VWHSGDMLLIATERTMRPRFVITQDDEPYPLGYATDPAEAERQAIYYGDKGDTLEIRYLAGNVMTITL